MFNYGRLALASAFFTLIAATACSSPAESDPPASGTSPATSNGGNKSGNGTTSEQSPTEPKTPPKDPAPPSSDAGNTPTCCAGKGVCVPDSAVPKEQKEYLSAQECKDQALCVPAENISPSFKPTACTGGQSGTEKGVCLSKCLELPYEQLLTEGTCDKEHLCVPCINPLTKQPSGAPGCQ